MSKNAYKLIYDIYGALHTHISYIPHFSIMFPGVPETVDGVHGIDSKNKQIIAFDNIGQCIIWNITTTLDPAVIETNTSKDCDLDDIPIDKPVSVTRTMLADQSDSHWFPIGSIFWQGRLFSKPDVS